MQFKNDTHFSNSRKFCESGKKTGYMVPVGDQYGVLYLANVKTFDS